MSKFRKKPVEIEAEGPLLPYTGPGSDNAQELADWCGGRSIWRDGATCVEIKTLEGVMYASPGDYIIKGVQGEFYPCKPDIFHATYEAVDDD